MPFIEDKFIDVDSLWRSTKIPVRAIGDFKLESRIVTFLRINKDHTMQLLGVIKWLGKINSIDCAGINLVRIYLCLVFNIQLRMSHINMEILAN